jgi:LCP family protein required for cell wall assembly
MHKHSQDDPKDPTGNAAGQIYNEQNPMSGMGEGQNVLPAPAKGGLISSWKTGQLQPPAPERNQGNPVRNSAEETEFDPLSHRQMPRLSSQQPPMPQPPAPNSFSVPTNDAATMRQPVSPNRPPYPPQPQNRGGAYPSGTFNNPNMAPPPASNYGYQGPNPANNYPIPGPRPAQAPYGPGPGPAQAPYGPGPGPGPAQAPYGPGPRITRDLNNLGQYPGAMPPGNQGAPNGYPYTTDQFGNPMGYGNFNNAPPGFAQPPATIKPGKRTKKRLPIWARIVIAAVAFLVVTGGSAFAYYEFTIGKSVADITGNSATHEVDGKEQAIQSAPVDPLTTRTNILLLGSDTDGKYPGEGGNDPTTGQPLAQTVIIVTIDPQTNYVGMLSIPRDMQVTDGGYVDEKLDQAFEHAWVGTSTKAKAAAAAGYMEDVIKQNYGITINHYAWVGLQGFTKVVDDIGGVDINVTHPMFDDDYPDDSTGGANYGYTRVNIAPGPQHLTGAEALTYVRTRHADLGGDFGRTARQQQLLDQIKEKLMKSSNIISEMTSIINDLDGYMFTDFTLSQLSQFATVAKTVDINKVDHVSFTNNYATPITSNNNGNFAPNCPLVNAEVQKMFGVVGTCIPQYASISPQTGTSLASTQTTTTETADTTETSSGSTQTNSTNTPTEASMTAVSQSIVGNSSNFNNLLNLMLLTASGSFNVMQG